ncbi:hypothetical protein ABOM_011147 [Aspergillus bombycis]|uniref:NADH:flavin oxidoreductase/NADH oxidase N-terminal domain-containing protein n=1 Tax=Aspergillus bombycis TaxID=109264 RepID=A0A1F7ZNT0_9EURO|nr:hypothetical protein ABOM_011147 [Aspergillus bombycis]OGM40788.1 hypothetical protein ABOM_011147 [Aspergillus bombycis]
MTMPSPLNNPVNLPCGVVFPNRIVKASMAEMMCGQGNLPNDDLAEAYNQWGRGGWGAVLTGNVQVDVNHLGTPYDPAVHGSYTGEENGKELLPAWKSYAKACTQHGTPCIVQINHPGRQSLRLAGKRGICGSTIAPSSVPLVIDDNFYGRLISRITFPHPREMMQEDIDTVTAQFVDTARLMADSGFTGVQLHGAHGYLIDQFLNPTTNMRTDSYGGSPSKRAKFALGIISSVRAAVPANFCVGMKLNSADHSSDTFEDTMAQIGLFVEAGIDFLEVSGGSYTNPEMMNTHNTVQEKKSSRSVAREAFFLEFATETRKRYPNLVLMLTGGFRTRGGAEYAIEHGACDLIGVARPAAINPSFPKLLLNESVADEDAKLQLKRVPPPFYARCVPGKAVGMGLETAYYSNQIKRISKGLKTIPPSS